MDDGSDIRRILKVYNYVNDDTKTKVNIKFVGLVAAFVAVSALLVAYAAWGPYGSADTTPAAAAEEQTEFVGLTEVEAALYGSDAERIEARLGSWVDQHPEAEVLAMERVYDDNGLWIGYEITYRE